MPRICSFGDRWPADSGFPNPNHTALAAVVEYMTETSKIISSSVYMFLVQSVSKAHELLSERKLSLQGLDLPKMKEEQANLQRAFTSADFESIAQSFKRSIRYEQGKYLSHLGKNIS